MKTNEIIKQLNEQLTQEKRQSAYYQIKLILHALNMLLAQLENNKNCPNIYCAMQDQTKKLNEIMLNY